MSVGAVENGSFESDSISGGCFSEWGTITGWDVISATGNNGVQQGCDGWGGLYTRYGAQYLAMQSSGTFIQQTVPVTCASGPFEVAFWAAQRPGFGNTQRLQVLANDVVVFEPELVQLFAEYRFNVTATGTSVGNTLTLKFRNSSPETCDCTVLLDQITLAHFTDSTCAPTAAPTPIPTANPTSTATPTISPTLAPTHTPTNAPTTSHSPTSGPTSGYLGDGIECEDVDECGAAMEVCARDASCENLPGWYTCKCLSGYEGEPHAGAAGAGCMDVDECGLEDGACGTDAICSNFLGGFNCTCVEGFDLSHSGDCSDIDECTVDNGGCWQSDHAQVGGGGARQACLNSRGGWACGDCPAGFALHGSVANATCEESQDDLEELDALFHAAGCGVLVAALGAAAVTSIAVAIAHQQVCMQLLSSRAAESDIWTWSLFPPTPLDSVPLPKKSQVQMPVFEQLSSPRVSSSAEIEPVATTGSPLPQSLRELHSSTASQASSTTSTPRSLLPWKLRFSHPPSDSTSPNREDGSNGYFSICPDAPPAAATSAAWTPAGDAAWRRSVLVSQDEGSGSCTAKLVPPPPAARVPPRPTSHPFGPEIHGAAAAGAGAGPVTEGKMQDKLQQELDDLMTTSVTQEKAQRTEGGRGQHKKHKRSSLPPDETMSHMQRLQQPRRKHTQSLIMQSRERSASPRSSARLGPGAETESLTRVVQRRSSTSGPNHPSEPPDRGAEVNRHHTQSRAAPLPASPLGHSGDQARRPSAMAVSLQPTPSAQPAEASHILAPKPTSPLSAKVAPLPAKVTPLPAKVAPLPAKGAPLPAKVAPAPEPPMPSRPPMAESPAGQSPLLDKEAAEDRQVCAPAPEAPDRPVPLRCCFHQCP
ncbi:hypothetical protein CYMTET_8775 [Cymbomonas tetramitiformis]|uniref:EGF-like domain-containing protein n=1 Tax=Cymbomonas tetramitiformis TaxID=36881 RepID=A0AAE0GSU7_9CHLO|nr:hypothetical protein CYMTET_8775 [Cymbomonas tetramitiformis]